MEEYVTIKKKNGTLRGMIHIPDQGKAPYPGVILYHGFAGNRMEPSFIFVRLSRLLMANGVASVRFDFLGSGESDGDFEEMTLSSEIEDGFDILDYFSGLPEIDRQRIFLLGLSMGGSIAGYVAGSKGSKNSKGSKRSKGADIKGLILWAAAGEMKKLARESSSADKSLPPKNPLDRKGLKLGLNFINDIENLEIMKVTSRYCGPGLIVHGSEDETVPPEVALEYKETLSGPTRLISIDGADHAFGSIPWQEELFSNTLDFILAND
jgi:fermentation-respiration switch protein FrsA (DUF1100 family)